MLSANIFYSGYNILFGILSLFLGIGSVFLIKDHKYFRGLFQFQLGGLLILLLTYLSTHEHVLYKIGLNYNFVSFVLMLIAMMTSLLWINAASELYNNTSANKETLTFYISLGLTSCVYYSFIDYGSGRGYHLSAVFTLVGISLLSLSTVLHFWQNRSAGNFLLILSVFMLCGKLIISTYFFKINWLNLNLFTWLWIYIFAVAVVFMRFNIYQTELQKSWNMIDKLNLQINNMIDLSPFPIIISRLTDNRLVLINDKAGYIFGLTKKELHYHKLNDFFVDENNRRQFFEILEKKHEVEDFDLMVCNLVTASPFWLSVSAKPVEYNNEMTLYMAFQDITLRKERENKIQNQADKDPLTMTWNRRYFEKVVPESIKNCIKKHQNFSLLLLDADKFKNINDTYGHKNGDKVLIQLAELCRHSLREEDIVARFGGEEFVIFLDNTDTKTASVVAERLRTTIENSGVTDDEGNIIRFTVSIGVVSSEKTASLEILLRQVDDAMYLAKHNGRNRIAVYDEDAVKNMNKRHKQNRRNNIHPVFQNEENEEFSLLDSYENKIL
ncbi:MAG: GGDEF domain-containing protein [Alphaproteobacteria bacterium]|nr:GGDEF domain-containing protein [Alphaproteobacteria bacterium]